MAAPNKQDPPRPEREPYRPPTLIHHGSLGDLTKEPPGTGGGYG